MRRWISVSLCVLVFFSVSPASAQFGAPFGGTGILTTPEVGGAIGAGAASSAAQQQQQQCGTVYAGRGGPQYQCSPPTAPTTRR